MSQVPGMTFGYINDQDPSLQSKSGGGKFGLNQGHIVKLEYNPNAGKDDTPKDAVDLHVEIADNVFRNRIFDTTVVYDSDGNELEDVNSQEYQTKYKEIVTQSMAVIQHALKSLGVTDEQLKQALATPASTFVDWAKIVTALVPDDFAKRPVDVFLEYQWNIGKNQNQTYLQVPKNMKGGRFLAPAQAGNWQAVEEWTDDKGKTHKGLAYVEASTKVVHPFTRNLSFMESKKANKQVKGEQPTGTGTPSAIAGGAGTDSAW